MRVLFYLGAEDWSGTARVVLAAARGLAARGHVLTVACCSGSRLELLAQEAGLETVSIDGAWFGSGGAWDLRKVLQARFIEVAIVTSDRDHRIVASAMRFAERGGVLRRVSAFEPFDAKLASALTLKMAPAGLIVSSPGEVSGAPPAGWSIPTTVAPIGVDIANYEGVDAVVRGDIGAPPQGLLIACDYSASEGGPGRNRMGAVFRALALLAPRHAYLHAVVFGPGSDDDELRIHASALGVGRVVSFLGERSGTDARRVMRAADAGWVASGGDAGALACLDFMALRVPVIAERWPLAEHFIADGINGLLVAPEEPSYMASAVAALLTAEDKRLAMGNSARARVAREFSETAMIDGFERAVTVAGDRTARATT